jgi:hypothetical protein
MKNTLILVLIMFNFLSGFSQNDLEELTSFLEQQDQSPKDYIFKLFETNDIIILGERDHRDTTQYDLILDILSDVRFIENVGHVYTEAGVINRTEWANKVLKEDYRNHQDFEKAFITLYRELDFNPVWEKYNMIKYLKGIYEINKVLDSNKKITVGLTDCAFSWDGMTHNKYRDFVDNVLSGFNTRDSIMADNFMKLYEQQIPIKGHKKALLIQSRPHAINLNIHYKGHSIKRTGSFIKSKYNDKVKIVALNWYKWIPDDRGSPENWGPVQQGIKLVENGKWDAAFEIMGKKAVGFDINNTPFGLTEFDYTFEQNISYQDLIDGIIFYKPFYEFTCTKGLPNIFDIEFAREYIKRQDLINGNSEYNEKNTPRG